VANVPAEERVTKQTGPLAAYGLVAPAAEFVATGKDGKIAGKLSIGNRSGGLAKRDRIDKRLLYLQHRQL
jgi:hypothetical protein